MRNVELQIEVGKWFVDNKKSSVECTKHFGFTSSTLTKILKDLAVTDPALYAQAIKIRNKAANEKAALGRKNNSIAKSESVVDANLKLALGVMRRIDKLKKILKIGDTVVIGKEKHIVKQKYDRFFLSDKKECFYYVDIKKVL